MSSQNVITRPDKAELGVAKKKVSAEQVRVLAVLMAEPLQWCDCNAVAHKTDPPGSTIRHLLFTFFKMGILDRLEVYGGYRYRSLQPRMSSRIFAGCRKRQRS
jgi:hypothetical protein